MSDTKIDINLGEAARRYLASLPAAGQEASQQEINSFVRWYRANMPMAELTMPQIARYAEHVARSGSDPMKKLEPVRVFLAFAKKQGLTKTNLSVHLRLKLPTAKGKTSGKGGLRETALTAQGYKALKQELDSLKKERPRVQEEIRQAAADKDVRENAPLEAAREHLGYVASRIRELEAIIGNAQVMKAQTQPVIAVSQGHKVTVRELESGETFSYILVDPQEVNPAKGKISVVSPVGKALLGKGTGAVIEVAAPAGHIHYRIEKVEP